LCSHVVIVVIVFQSLNLRAECAKLISTVYPYSSIIEMKYIYKKVTTWLQPPATRASAHSTRSHFAKKSDYKM